MSTRILTLGAVSLACALSALSVSHTAACPGDKKPSLSCPDDKKPSLSCPDDKKPSLACPDDKKPS